MSAADRMKRHRARRRGHRAVLHVDVRLDRLACALAEDEFINETERDQTTITRALEQAIEAYVATMIGPDHGDRDA